MNALLMASLGLQPIVDAPVWVVLVLKATAILSVAWLVHLAIARTNPRWRVFLWRVTAVSLFVLPPIAWLLPAVEICVEQSPTIEEATAVAATPHTPLGDRAVPGHGPLDLHDDPSDAEPEPPLQDTVGEPFGDPSELPQAQTFAPAPSEPSVVTMPVLLSAVWLGGFATLAFRLCIGYRRIWRLVGRAQRPPEWIRRECFRVAQTIGCRRRVEVLQSTDVQSPFLCGLGRSLVLLPERMCDTAYRRDLPGILAHELAHVRSRDVLWNVGLQLVSIVLWFHPQVWRMRKAHLAACELVCDAVSANFVGDVTDYCRTLARVAVDACGSLPAEGIAMTGTSSVSRRLSALKRRVFHSPLGRRSVLGFGCAALLAAATLGTLQLAFSAPPAAEPAEKSTPLADSADAMPGTGSIRVRVVDPQGSSLANASVHVSVRTEVSGFNRDYKTDAAGIARVELPKTYNMLWLSAGKEPFVTMFSHWGRNELVNGEGVPKEYTMRLESGTTAGGRIVDEQGKPIAGASVQVRLEGNLKPANGDGHTSYHTSLATETDAATTDAEGRWSIDNVPNHAQAELTLLVSHPQYISDEHWGRLQREAGATTAMLRGGTTTVTLRRGIIVQGQVTDPAGRPIKDAIVVDGDNPYSAGMGAFFFSTEAYPGMARKFLTDSNGRFQLPPMPPGERTLTVIAADFAPQLRRVNLQANLPPQDFRMEPGKPIRLNLVDTADKPVPNAYVSVIGWKGSMSLQSIQQSRTMPDTKIPERADADGVWHWNSAPDEPVKLYINVEGFADRELEIAGGAPPRTVTLKPEHRITGRVTDAVTGKPIPAFTVIPIDVFPMPIELSPKGRLFAERMNAVAGKDGRLDYLAWRTDVPQRLRVEAPGYRTQTGPEFRAGDDTPRTQDFPLQPSAPVVGVVLDAAGQPVAKVEVLLATPTDEARFDDSSGNQKSVTDATGRFEFPDSGEPFSLIARADAGFALADFPADRHDVGTLQLQPWASIHGQFRDGGRPIRGIAVYLDPVRLDSLDRPKIEATMYALTDADGRFEFPRAFPVPVRVQVGAWPRNDKLFRSGLSVPLDLQSGQQVELDLGGAGTFVKGKVTLTGKVPADLDYAYSLNYLVRRAPGIAPPLEIADAGFDIRNGWRETWLKTQEGRAYLSTLRHWFVKLAPDGTFRISGVPAGDYDLAIEIYRKPNGWGRDPLARDVVRVTVGAEDAARGELTLPEITAPVSTIPAARPSPRPTTPTNSLQLHIGPPAD